jgi:hypothetical protein
MELGKMAKHQKKKTPSGSAGVQCRPLDCINLGSCGWAVVSADALKPLTQKEAMAIMASYRALVELGVSMPA